jgi:predicted nucleic acid-binding protein
MDGSKRRLVVDTNALLSALINPESVIWSLLQIDEIEFVVPEIAVDELEKYEGMVNDKLEARNAREDYEYLIAELYGDVVVVPVSVYEDELESAYAIMEGIDEKDTEFLALALAFECSILSNDNDFQKQDAADVYTATEAIEKFLH